MNTRKAKERESRKKVILGSAMKVFSTKGFLSATMSDIADEAGFSKAALYFYFKSKEEIFLEGMEVVISDFKIFIDELGEGDGSAIDKIERLFYAILDYVDEKRELITILHSEIHNLYSSRSGQFKNILFKYKNFFIDGVRAILSQGMEEGTIAECDTELLAVILRGLITSLVIYRIDGGSMKSKECIDFVMKFIKNAPVLQKQDIVDTQLNLF